MSFKKDLIKFGLGARGPYGRMESGGQRLSETMGDWASETRESGWNQALIAASGEGKPITPEQQIEIADMWKVPLGQVMDSAQRINAPLKDKQVKNFAKSFYMRLEDVVKEGRKPDEKQIQQMIKDSGGNELDGMEARTIAMHVMQTTLPTLKDESFTLGPNQKRFKTIGGTTVEIADNKQDVKKTDTALEQKIEQIKLAYPGMDHKKVRRIATGTIKVVTDPFTGNTTLVDVGTGKTIQMTEQKQQASVEKPTGKPEGKPEETLWDMAELATGPVSAGLSAASVASGIVGGPVAKKTIKARQFISSAQNDLIRALSINPRFPVGEIKRLQKEINISPSVFDNPKMMRARMEAVNDYLHRRLRKEKQTSSDASRPMADRKAASAAAVDIEQFLKILGVPESTEIQGLSKEDQALIDKYK